MIEELKNIAVRAGKAVLEIYGEDDFQVELKGDDSPLTIADKKSNDVICEGLERLEIQYPILSEENKMIEYDDRKSYDRYWCVDPLDGTKEFVKRNGEFTINIALIENQESILGVVYIPVTDELYWAQKGQGAFRQKDGEVSRLQAPKYNDSDEGLVLVCSRSHLNEETQAFLNQYKDPKTLSRGSSLKFLSIAEGKAHIYPRLAPTMEWDTSAAQIVLEEAGGEVVQHETGEKLKYNKESLVNPWFVARAKRV